MATYVLIPGAGGMARYWSLVAPELRTRGHDVVAVDLPADDDSAGLARYADVTVNAIGDRTDLILVAQSMGAFSAPLVCQRVPVRLVILLNPMIPLRVNRPASGGRALARRRRCASTRSASA